MYCFFTARQPNHRTIGFNFDIHDQFCVFFRGFVHDFLCCDVFPRFLRIIMRVSLDIEMSHDIALLALKTGQKPAT